jgi:deazaflavin-dependent oxidoreductase (nitroreductase family)
VARAEVAQIERWGTSVVGLAARTPVLVLETTGRATGRRRRTPLAWAPRVGGGWLVVGGAAGQRRTPDWVANLRADGAATVVVGRRRVPVRAEELTGPARAATWAPLRRRWPRIERYERRAGRPVPVVALVPRPRAVLS